MAVLMSASHNVLPKHSSEDICSEVRGTCYWFGLGCNLVLCLKLGHGVRNYII